MQLVLTDRTPLLKMSAASSAANLALRRPATRLDFLLAGFGWCNMPGHMVARDIAEGRLKRLEIPRIATS